MELFLFWTWENRDRGHWGISCKIFVQIKVNKNWTIYNIRVPALYLLKSLPESESRGLKSEKYYERWDGKSPADTDWLYS